MLSSSIGCSVLAWRSDIVLGSDWNAILLVDAECRLSFSDNTELHDTSTVDFK